MTCIRMNGAIVCLANTEEFEGRLFEWHSYFGPMMLNRRTLEPYARMRPSDWKILERYAKTKKQPKENQ